MRHRRLHDDSGTALVEFALVAPLLFLLLLGMLEFGRAFNYWIDETHLANEGARFAAVNRNPGGTTTGDFADFLRSQMTTKELREGTGSVTGVPEVCFRFLKDGVVTSTPIAGDAVEVTVSAEFDWLPIVDSRLGVTSTDIVGKSVMRLEQAPSTYTAGCA